MFIRKKTYPSLIIRSVLLIGYVFLFAVQSNYQYFNIANFFVYGHDVAAAADTGVAREQHANSMAPQQQEAPQHSLTLQDRHQRLSHLGIDKRYHLQQGIRIPPIRAPGITGLTITRTRVYAPTPVYFSATPPTNSLRGPPSAA